MLRRAVLVVIVSLGVAAVAHAQIVRCAADSPERQGKPGCSIIADKRLPSLAVPVFWHIDEFASLDDANKSASPASIAFAAHGSAWLATVESDTSTHHGGKHRGVVGPLPVERNRAYSMTVMSAYFLPGNFSNVHTHSGPEAWWVLEGEQCLETTTSTIRAHAGEGAIVPVGETMRLVATGTTPRRSLVLILHDAAHPATTILKDPPPLQRCQ